MDEMFNESFDLKLFNYLTKYLYIFELNIQITTRLVTNISFW